MAQSKDQDVLKYYSQNQEQLRSETQQLEFRICENLLKAYTNGKKLKILELGAGAGHYTEFLARLGHHITVCEPSRELIQLNEERLTHAGLKKQITWFQKDAREVSTSLTDKKSFDIILSMGPMYHIFDEAEHKQLFQDLLSLLQDEGLMMTVFLSRVGFMSYVLAKHPETLLKDSESLRDILLKGFDPNHPKDGTFRGFFADLKYVVDLHATTGWGLATMHVLDPCLGGRDATFNSLSEEQKTAWSEVLTALSSNADYWNSGRTWLAIATKAKAPA